MKPSHAPCGVRVNRFGIVSHLNVVKFDLLTLGGGDSTIPGIEQVFRGKPGLRTPYRHNTKVERGRQLRNMTLVFTVGKGGGKINKS